MSAPIAQMTSLMTPATTSDQTFEPICWYPYIPTADQYITTGTIHRNQLADGMMYQMVLIPVACSQPVVQAPPQQPVVQAPPQQPDVHVMPELVQVQPQPVAMQHQPAVKAQSAPQTPVQPDVKREAPAAPVKQVPQQPAKKATGWAAMADGLHIAAPVKKIAVVFPKQRGDAQRTREKEKEVSAQNEWFEKNASNPSFRTQFCKNMENEGKCKYGDKCFYAHNDKELRTAPPKPCNYGANCLHLATCQFDHGVMDDLEYQQRLAVLAMKNERFYKRENCTRENCKYGNACHFAHTDDRIVMCYCDKTDCNNLHPGDLRELYNDFGYEFQINSVWQPTKVNA
jgi:hypothetical protein